MYQKLSESQRVGKAFLVSLAKRGLQVDSMTYNMLLYEWACYINDIAVYSHEYKGIENRVRFPKAMLLSERKTYNE